MGRMLIPGEPLWTPRLPYRLPGTPWRNPAHDTARVMARIGLGLLTAWLLIHWVTIDNVRTCDEDSTCVSTTT